MTTKFKVGDRVRCINKEYNLISELIIGKEYIITAVYGNAISINENVVREVHWTASQFELVEEEPCCKPYSCETTNMCESAYYRLKKHAEEMSTLGIYKTQYGDGLLGQLGDVEVYVSKNLPNKKQTIMSKITNFAKNLTLSADEKLLRKYGLKTECGEYTDEADTLVQVKLMKENEAYLIELAKGMELEEKNK